MEGKNVNSSEKRIESLEKRIQSLENLLEKRVSKTLQKIRPIDIEKYSSLVKRMNILDDKIEDLKKEESSLEKLRPEVNRTIENLNRKISNTLMKNKMDIKHADEEILILKNQLAEVRKLDIKRLLREMEVLKMKTRWLEEHVDRFDVKPIFEMIDELESRIKAITSTTPMVIE